MPVSVPGARPRCAIARALALPNPILWQVQMQPRTVALLAMRLSGSDEMFATYQVLGSIRILAPQPGLEQNACGNGAFERQRHGAPIGTTVQAGA